jgi:putative flippase GtrA
MENPNPLARGARADAARREVQRLFKFLVVGGIGFLIDTGSLSVLVLIFSVDRVVAKGIAFSLAVLSNFVLNRLWTYRDSRSKGVMTQVAQFVLVSGVGLAINLVVFNFTNQRAAHWFGPVITLYIAQACAVGIALFWNYAANRLITYNDVAIGH